MRSALSSALSRPIDPMLSVIICTHNPRDDYLRRALAALRGQSLPQSHWEILVIDNRSEKPLANTLDLSWHIRARIIREEELGLTPARVRGLKEAEGDVLIFVDDDNVLNSGYLAFAEAIKQAHPSLGVWGASVEPDFEELPTSEMAELVPFLGLRKIERDFFCNFPSPYQPIGAGMCIRRAVAETYLHAVTSDPRRKNLDRKGSSLLGCGDFDIVYTALDEGFGYGIFHELKVVHLIPKRRVTPEYLKAIVAGCEASGVILSELRNPGSAGRPDPRSFSRRVFSRVIDWTEKRGASRSNQIKLAAMAIGRQQGLEIARSLQTA